MCVTAVSGVIIMIFFRMNLTCFINYLLSVLIYNDMIRYASLTLVDTYQSVVRKAGSSGPVLR